MQGRDVCFSYTNTTRAEQMENFRKHTIAAIDRYIDSNEIYDVCSKSIEIEAVFTKTEIIHKKRRSSFSKLYPCHSTHLGQLAFH